jgi:amino acid transporter
MTAICTNGEVGSGGFYFMISRSLGPETGATFGVLYFLTNAIMVAFSIIGVCEEISLIFQVSKFKYIFEKKLRELFFKLQKNDFIS